MKKLFIVLLALAFCFAAVPALAQDKAEWNWYGQVRMWTAYEKVDAETRLGGDAGSRAAAWAPGFGLSVQDDEILDWQMQTNSRLGVNVKWGSIGGTVEFGHQGSAARIGGSGDYGATFRQFFATWNFGPGTLILGKTYTPYFFLVSGLCGPGGGECNGIGFGSIYAGRAAQITLQMGGFKFGLVEPDTRFLPLNGTASLATGLPVAIGAPDVDQWLPRIEASYTFNLGPAAIYIGGLYQTYDVETATAAGLDEFSVDSWSLGIGARTAFGPLYVNGTFQYGNNVGSSGVLQNMLFTRALIDPVDFEEEDNTYMAAQLVVGFKVMDTLGFEGGVVWNTGDADIIGGGGSVEQSQWVYYIQATFSPAKNVFIVPEFCIVDNGDLEISGLSDTDLGKVTWFGIKWQINF